MRRMLMSVPTHTKALDLAYIALMAALIALVLVSRVKKHLAL